MVETETYWIVDYKTMADGKRLTPVIIGGRNGYPSELAAQRFIDAGNGLSPKAAVFIAHSRNKSKAMQEIKLQLIKKNNSIDLGMRRMSHKSPEQRRLVSIQED
jgi:hypothetical protein